MLPPSTEALLDSPKPLLGFSDIRSIANRLGIRPTKKLGQNFVVEPNAVLKIVADSGISAKTPVLEVGPGLGSLTLALLHAGAYVSAIEIDPVLAGELPRTVRQHQPQAAGRFALLEADALTVTSANMLPLPPELAAVVQEESDRSDHISENIHTFSIPKNTEQIFYQPTHLVANLPYNVAVPVLLSLLSVLPSLQSITVMVQAEVADRLSALPGTRIYGAPSVKLAWFGKARKGAKISRHVFWPVPNVDSALIHVQLFNSFHTHPMGAYAQDQERYCARNTAGNPEQRERVFRIIDAAFSQRRKTLRSALASWAGSGMLAEKILHEAHVNPASRAENLTIDDYIKIDEVACIGAEQKTLQTDRICVSFSDQTNNARLCEGEMQ